MENIIILPILIALQNPADFSGKTMYPSGIKEIDGRIFNDYKQTTNLMISIPETKKIPSGYYNAIITDDKKFLYVSQNNGTGYFLPIIKTNILDKPNQFKSIELSEVNGVKILIYKDIENEYVAIFD